MNQALWLLALQGLLGAFDTLYYHEWRARLTARGPAAYPELRLHAARDFLYALLFATLPALLFRGVSALGLALVLLAEIVITLQDFMIEDRVRAGFGGVLPGERATHAIMGIVYGAMLACLIPTLRAWWQAPTALVYAGASVPEGLRLVLWAMAAGVALSGVRDLGAVFGLAASAWPWDAAVASDPRP
jgi:hypothetical protein